MANFDLSKYLGTWYEWKSYGNVFQNMATTCPKAEYKANDQGTVDVTNTGVMRIGGMKAVFEATAAPQTDGKDGKFVVAAKILDLIKAPYWIIDSDYTSFAIVYSCMKVPYLPIHSDSVWVLTRERNPTNAAEIEGKVKAAMAKAKLDASKLRKSQQEGCTN